MAVYTPQSQIKTNLYSNGDYVKVTTGLPYVGFYHKLANGQAFTGRDPEDVPIILLRSLYEENAEYGQAPRATEYYIDLNSNLSLDRGDYTWLNSVGPFEANQDIGSIILLDQRRAPTYSKRLPEQREYERGYMDRYFVYNLKNFQYFETTEEDYLKMVYNPGKIDSLTFKPYKIKWFISAVSRTVVKRKNLGFLNYYKEIYNAPGIVNHFKESLDEYYKRKKYDLFTPGGELLKNGVNYVGSYHIHPTRGPMEGAKHTTTPHAVLT